MQALGLIKISKNQIRSKKSEECKKIEFFSTVFRKRFFPDCTMEGAIKRIRWFYGAHCPRDKEQFEDRATCHM